MTRNEIDEALSKIPRKSAVQSTEMAYDLAYTTAMERAFRYKGRKMELMVDLFSWTMAGKLCTNQLQHALAVRHDKLRLDAGDFPDVQDLIRLSAGLLVSADGAKCPVINLVHYTLAEFLRRKHRQYLPMVHYKLAAACLRYLSYENSESDLMPYPIAPECGHGSGMILEPHASRTWEYHVGQIRHSDMTEDLESRLCGAATAFFRRHESWTQQSINEKDPLWADVRIHPFFVLAKNGLALLWKAAMETGANPNVRDYFGRTALSHAAERGHLDMVTLLLQYGHGNEADRDGLYPISYAAKNGHAQVIEMLLPVSDLNVTDRSGRSVLSYAAQSGDIASFQLLFANSSTELLDDRGRSALFYAAHYGTIEVVNLLLPETRPQQAAHELTAAMAYLADPFTPSDNLKHLPSSLCGLPQLLPGTVLESIEAHDSPSEALQMVFELAKSDCCTALQNDDLKLRTTYSRIEALGSIRDELYPNPLRHIKLSGLDTLSRWQGTYEYYCYSIYSIAQVLLRRSGEDTKVLDRHEGGTMSSNVSDFLTPSAIKRLNDILVFLKTTQPWLRLCTIDDSNIGPLPHKAIPTVLECDEAVERLGIEYQRAMATDGYDIEFQQGRIERDFNGVEMDVNLPDDQCIGLPTAIDDTDLLSFLGADCPMYDPYETQPAPGFVVEEQDQIILDDQDVVGGHFRTDHE